MEFILVLNISSSLIRSTLKARDDDGEKSEEVSKKSGGSWPSQVRVDSLLPNTHHTQQTMQGQCRWALISLRYMKLKQMRRSLSVLSVHFVAKTHQARVSVNELTPPNKSSQETEDERRSLKVITKSIVSFSCKSRRKSCGSLRKLI